MKTQREFLSQIYSIGNDQNIAITAISNELYITGYFKISHYCSTVFISLLCTSYCLLNSYSEDSGEIMFFLLLPIGSLKSVFHGMKLIISPER